MTRFQQTLASQASFEKHGRKSKRELFLDQMNQVVPWSELLALVEPFYPKAGNGRQPVGLAIMLRTYFLQQWFSLSDPGMEEAFYASPVLRRFAGGDLGVAAAPDETTTLAQIWSAGYPKGRSRSLRERRVPVGRWAGANLHKFRNIFAEQPSEQPFAHEKENRLWRLLVRYLFYWSYGGRGRNRTYNLSVKSRMLCQLSYASG